MGPTWGRQDPGGPHVGPMNLTIRGWKRQSLKKYMLFSILQIIWSETHDSKANQRDLIFSSIWIQIFDFFSQFYREIIRMTSKNNRAPLPGCIKLCGLFQSHQWIQTGFTVRKCSSQVKIGNFLPRVTFKLNRLPWETTGAHLLWYSKLCASFHSHQ